MKWTEKEIEKVLSLVKEGKKYSEISLIIGRTNSSVRNKLLKLQEGYDKNNPKEVVIKKCTECSGDIKNSGIKFCSRSCSTKYNNRLRRKTRTDCINCGNKLHAGKKYCSYNCQSEYERNIVFSEIEQGNTKLHFKNYKRYLIHKHGEKCMECGWCEVNKYSGKIPIELEHIDGDSSNNKLGNLKILCPNCHSLTPTYKGMNKGNGRHSRMERYKQNKSY